MPGQAFIPGAGINSRGTNSTSARIWLGGERFFGAGKEACILPFLTERRLLDSI